MRKGSKMTTESPVYTPIRDHGEELAKAEAGVATLALEREDRWYPKYHIASNGGWINDPNGLCYYKGRWHVYYQLHPYGTQWGPMHWGHVSSADMAAWRREPIAMAPSLEQEKDGVFSGSAVIDDDGKLRFYYTGERYLNGIDPSGGQWQVQMAAVAEDDEATKLNKLGMVVDCPREKVHQHFRDPKVFKWDGVWYMVHGVSDVNDHGQLWLYTSNDMVHWEFKNVLFQDPDPDVYMLECPDFFPLKDKDGNTKWVIVFSAMGAEAQDYMNRNNSNAVYMIGTWEPGEAFKPETELRLLDCGANYYAPQSFEANGRRIMYGWMSPFKQHAPMQSDGWCGQMTLPRECYLGEDGDLHTVPVPETDRLRINTFEHVARPIEANEEALVDEDAEAVEIELDIDLNDTTAERAGLKVHATSDGSYTYVAYDAQAGTVVVDRQAAARGDRGYRAAKLTDAELNADELKLHVYVDRGSVEVYVNDGLHVLSSYSYPSEGKRGVLLSAESGVLAVDRLIVHDLKSIGLE
ncbi:glycoside hydrolase family 32 protein [Bifidobacterium sp. ESL0764]|uniref:glycoside hydrolase family 32 protein n=1 Tax=Bifidobacterium sp. ESL0764 TaxID=2983228 RepID=UPI0023F695DB|nr:glycoside hydrolase family 32 protein [Bifidobacterium sp. ESL0764]WEV66326.1 glycoside hydrolase family 32 protein [Bifidobacterium sp. ESL0764]